MKSTLLPQTSVSKRDMRTSAGHWLGRLAFWLGVLAFIYEVPGFLMLAVGTMGAYNPDEAIDRVGNVVMQIWAGIFLAAIVSGVGSLILSSKGRRKNAILGIALALLALARFGPNWW